MATHYVVKKVPKVEIRGIQNGVHTPPISAAQVWFVIEETQSGGRIGDGYEDRETADAECERLNEKFK
ncbi:hypothetical protein CCL11_25715 [Pseudomonas syringae]|uniref:hypothetical protein n=1 Tax=Pseudomonas syringae TaxID=317 RepID=UPI000BB67293|nr:hypothetical protein [Pseudomonas syringae]PBP34585.1 hypothetical protein CCL11_25715 [Pseudomonas syringae]